MSDTTQTPVPSGRRLSDSLKARLKRCGRYHSSPSTVSDSATKHVLSSTPDSPTVHSQGKVKSRTNVQVSLKGETSDDDRLPMKVTKYANSTDDESLTAVNQTYVLNKEEEALTISHYDKQFDTTPVVSRQKRKSKGLSFRTSKLVFNDPEMESQNETFNESGNICLTKMFKDTNPDKCDNIQERSGKSDLENSSNVRPLPALIQQKEKFQSLLCDKEETLRKLNMVKMYRSKNNLDHLNTLTNKWKEGSQQALIDLHQLMSEPKPSFTELINHLQIDHRLIGYNEEDENFI